MLKANVPSNVIMFLVGVRVLGGLGVLPADAGLHVVGDDGAAGHEVEQQRHHQRRHQVRRHRRHPRLHTGARRQGQGSLDVAETGHMVSRASRFPNFHNHRERSYLGLLLVESTN